MNMANEEALKAQGKVVRVGLAQVNNPTPLVAKYIFRAIAFLSGIWALLPQDLLNVHDDMYGQINRWIIVGNTVILFAIKFFGWDYKQD